ncbi:MAG: hypothetical protein AB7G68_16290 [Nitrospiraceae bacterium]
MIEVAGHGVGDTDSVAVGAESVFSAGKGIGAATADVAESDDPADEPVGESVAP